LLLAERPSLVPPFANPFRIRMAKLTLRRRWRGPPLGGPLQRGCRFCFAAHDGEVTTSKLAEWEKEERQIRKSFAKLDQLPKILIVTEKLLTGYDAPVLYAMYLDKPMRDHTLLQAIARVNRPYENERDEMRKPHGFVLDFVGIFDKLEKALAFDSDEVNAIVKDIALLKHLFKAKMESKAPTYLSLITRAFNDKDVDNLIERFRDKDRRKEFFKEYKEIEMLYEIISPDAFLRPFIADYTTLSSIYVVVRNAYAKTVYVDRAFQKKTNELVQRHIDTSQITSVGSFVEIGSNTIELIKSQKGGDSTKVINLIKSIEKTAEENTEDPFLIALAERAKTVQESYEDRQTAVRRWTNFSRRCNRTWSVGGSRQHAAWMASAISSCASSTTRE
jgi:type I restriction enzyme R subunit